MKVTTNNIIIAAVAISATAFSIYGETSIKRGRNEGTLCIPASNVSGNGNLTLFSSIGGSISKKALMGNALVGAQIGVAEIMQIKAGASFINFQKFGPAEAHLQFTIPGNDRLRFFGIAALGDLYLSTSLDTISLNADATKPFYSPFLLPSLIIDLDWLSMKKQLPLKTYLYFGLADNPQLLFQYHQLSFKLGAEWKMYQHSIFIESGLALYKEKPNKYNLQGDERFKQTYAWFQPGARYRILNRFSLVGGLYIAFFQKVKNRSTLVPDIFSITLRFEAPLFFRETNTEAIRTLVFMEKEKKASELSVKNIGSEKDKLDGYKTLFQELGEEGVSMDFEKDSDEMKKRREEIQKKMKEIEALLEETE